MSDRNHLISKMLTLKDSIIDHDKLIESEREIQSGMLEKLWVLSQRYSILQKGGPTKLQLPAEAINDPQNEIRAEFLSKLCSLQNSNFRLASSLSTVNNLHNSLRQFLDEQKAGYLEICDKESTLLPPLHTYIQILDDFVKFYTKFQAQIDCHALLITPANASSVERYKKTLKHNKDFSEYFCQSLALFHALKKTS